MKINLYVFCVLLTFSLMFISCGNSDDEVCYNMGYERGKEDIVAGEENNCQGTLEYMAWRNMAGNQEDKKRSFCEGYEDGYNKKPNKYPEETSK